MYVACNMMVKQTILDHALTDINHTIDDSLMGIYLKQIIHLFTVIYDLMMLKFSCLQYWKFSKNVMNSAKNVFFSY